MIGLVTDFTLELELTANQITLTLFPVVVGVLVVGLVAISRKRKKNQPPTAHGPHHPGLDYDPKEIVRSKGSGMADGGVG
jgi:hypothetical protein